MGAKKNVSAGMDYKKNNFYKPANCVCGGYTVFMLSVSVCVRASVTFCFPEYLEE